MPTCGGVILCGGKSSRMGTPKAWLKFDDETALERCVRILHPLVSPLVVVAAQEQDLPPLPADVRILRDDHDSLGPLAALAVGLRALEQEVPAAFCISCDVPFLQPAVVNFLISQLGEHEIVAVRDGEFWHPLAAVYRTHLASRIGIHLNHQQRRLRELIEESETLPIPAETLRQFDPQLLSLQNINTPEAYSEALLWLSQN